MNKLLLLGRAALGNKPVLDNQLTTPWEIKSWLPDESTESYHQLVSQADAIVLGSDALLAGGWDIDLSSARALRLLHLSFSGYEWLKSERVPAGCSVCNVYEHASTIAEYVLATMLESAIGLRRIDQDFRGGSWRYSGSAYDLSHGEVRGKTVGIVGYGRIGREVASRALAFGMDVIAVSRRCPADTRLAWSGEQKDIEVLLARSDYVVLACELNEQTRDLINQARLSRMKASAVLINVARGPVVDEESLYNALKNKTIAGAAIDVWYQYPKTSGETVAPSRFPFESLDNVLMTPHCASWTQEQHTRRWCAIARNLDHLARAETLENLVAVSPGQTPVRAATAA